MKPNWVDECLALALANMIETYAITVPGSELPGYFDGYAVMRCYPMNPGDDFAAWLSTRGNRWRMSISWETAMRIRADAQSIVRHVRQRLEAEAE